MSAGENGPGGGFDGDGDGAISEREVEDAQRAFLEDEISEGELRDVLERRGETVDSRRTDDEQAPTPPASDSQSDTDAEAGSGSQPPVETISDERNRERAHKAARLAAKHEITQREIAERMDVSQASVSAYLKMYRQGTFKHAELE